MEITVIGPNSGPIGGGTPVDIKIKLKGLDRDTLAFLAVNFGQLAATDVEVKEYDEQDPDEGTITATSPPAEAGTVDITVITPGGDDEATAQNAFTYTAAVLTSVEPDKASVGVLVLIKGSGFIEVNSVTFGDQSAVFLCVSSSPDLCVGTLAARPQLVSKRTSLGGDQGRNCQEGQCFHLQAGVVNKFKRTRSGAAKKRLVRTKKPGSSARTTKNR